MEEGELFLHVIYNIVPEFPSFLILPLFILSTLTAVLVYRRKPARKAILFEGQPDYLRYQNIRNSIDLQESWLCHGEGGKGSKVTLNGSTQNSC